MSDFVPREFYIYFPEGWRKLVDTNITKILLDVFSKPDNAAYITINSALCEIRIFEQIIVDKTNHEYISFGWKEVSTGKCFIPPNPRFVRYGPCKLFQDFNDILENLDMNSLEYKDVVNMYRSGPSRSLFSFDTSQVTNVLKVKSPLSTRTAFEDERERLKYIRGDPNIRNLWHGTTLENIKSILHAGFAIPPRAINGHVYGFGVYFSSINGAYYSRKYAKKDENGEEHLLLCRVMCGREESTVDKPDLPYHPSSDEYDSGTAPLLKGASMHIIWGCHLHNRIMIEYIVSVIPKAKNVY